MSLNIGANFCDLAIYECQLVSYSAELVKFLTRHAKCVACSSPIQISADNRSFDNCACGNNIEDKYDAFCHLRFEKCALNDFIINVRFDSSYREEFQELWDVVSRRIVDRKRKLARFKVLGKYGKILSKSQAGLLLEAQEFKCYYCKKDVSKGYDLDHKRSVADGGTNDIKNIVVACPNCNRKKGKRSKDEFIELRQEKMSLEYRRKRELWRKQVDKNVSAIIAKGSANKQPYH